MHVYLLHSVDIVVQIGIKEHILKCVEDLFACFLFAVLSSPATVQDFVPYLVMLFQSY